MKLTDLLEASTEYPFIYAYPMENTHDIAATKNAWNWTVRNYGESVGIREPSVWVVGHDHMQHAARRANHFTQLNGQVYGWYSQAYPNKVFISDRISPAKSKQMAAILVHEFTHYLQDNTAKHDNIKPFGQSHVAQLEAEADDMMHRYARS
jgi:hypothetical protein